MRILLIIFSLITTITLQAQENRDVTYIRKHALLAVQEMQMFKVPASITLAQGLLETGGGQSRLAEHANNHFGIKCKNEKEWPLDKPRIYHDDDARGECFRSYTSVQDSYRDHSEFLALRPYYKELFKLSSTDYKSWAHGLKKAGYATDPTYASKLIARIEKYNLNQFDQISEEEVYAKLFLLYNNNEDQYYASNNNSKTDNSKVLKSNQQVEESVNSKPVDEKRPTIVIENRKQHPQSRIKNHPNNIAYVVAEAGETLGTIGKMYKKTPSELAKYNEIRLGTKLKEGQIVFFDMKKTKGSQTIYTVNDGEDLYSISQKFGVKITNLYKYNNIGPGEQLSSGQEIYLKTKRKS